MDDIDLVILPSGHIKFKRGDKAHNEKVREIISHMVDNDEDILNEIDEFFKGSEGCELLIGTKIFCG